MYEVQVSVYGVAGVLVSGLGFERLQVFRISSLGLQT